MYSTCRPITLVLSAIGVLVVSILLDRLVGRGDTLGWTSSAVYNWDQYGFATLHGKLVTNPGGFEALTKPEIYQGHSPASFYPVFAVDRLLSSLGDGLLMFHLVFSLVLFFSVWHLLGRNQLALIAAWATVLCPGYSIYPTVGDPNAVALYMVVPFAAMVVGLLSGKTLPPLRLTLLAALIFAYTSLNWSTAFGHGILFSMLLVMPAVPRARLGVYLGLSGLSVGVVGCFAVLDKMGGGAGTTGGIGFLNMLAGYTWGHCGYGSDLTTGKAIVRLSVANVVGLLPLLGLMGWFVVKFRNASWRMEVLALLPVLAAMMGVMFMRNYFGHHPWMAVPMLMPGLVLSLALLFRRNPTERDQSTKPTSGLMFLAACFLYALAILGAHRVYNAEALELTVLVLQRTARTDTIVLVESLDPQMVAQAEALGVSCDRHVVVLPDLKSPMPPGGNAYVLSAVNLADQLPVYAMSKKSALPSLQFIGKMKAWYVRTISRRGPQDRHFEYTTGAVFGLYSLSPTTH